MGGGGGLSEMEGGHGKCERRSREADAERSTKWDGGYGWAHEEAGTRMPLPVSGIDDDKRFRGLITRSRPSGEGGWRGGGITANMGESLSEEIEPALGTEPGLCMYL